MMLRAELLVHRKRTLNFRACSLVFSISYGAELKIVEQALHRLTLSSVKDQPALSLRRYEIGVSKLIEMERKGRRGHTKACADLA